MVVGFHRHGVVVVLTEGLFDYACLNNPHLSFLFLRNKSYPLNLTDSNQTGQLNFPSSALSSVQNVKPFRESNEGVDGLPHCQRACLALHCLS